MLRQDTAFEGTFKPKTILNNNLPQHADDGGMPFGTFGGPALLKALPDERKSYALDDNHQSFRHKHWEIGDSYKNKHGDDDVYR